MLRVGLFVTSLAVLLTTNIALALIFGGIGFTSLSNLIGTFIVVGILVILILMSIQIFGSGLSNAIPIVAFVVIASILYKITLPIELTSNFENVTGVDIGIGLVTNIIDKLGTDYNNFGFYMIHGIGFLCLGTGVMSVLGIED